MGKEQRGCQEKKTCITILQAGFFYDSSSLGAQIKYKIMQPTMHTPVPLALSYICPFNSESEDIKERFDNDIRKAITDVQQS